MARAKPSVGELQDEIKHRDRRIEELRQEIDEQRDLIRRLEENVDDAGNVIERWKETFDMTTTDSGGWTWEPFWDGHNDLVNRFNDLVRRWNKYVPVINDRAQPVGRPLAASEDERDLVLKLRKRGMSLRDIAEEAGVGLNTVRTIVDKANGSDRATRRRWQKAHPDEVWRERTYEPLGRIEIDRQQATRWKRQKRTGDALPKQAQRVVEEGRALVQEAKGLKR
jgi:lambda repressor-like predicted transcriptional regulator